MNIPQELRHCAPVAFVLLLPFLVGACKVSGGCEGGENGGVEYWKCDIRGEIEFWVWDGSGSPYVIEGPRDQLLAEYGYLLQLGLIDLTVDGEPVIYNAPR